MSIAIIGAGLQGCCAALELAARGLSVDLFDRAALPMQATSRINEGKIHLGYVYAKDVTLATARIMVRGAFCFDAFMRRHLSGGGFATRRSTPFMYGVHRDSQIGPRNIAAHFAAVDRLIAEASGPDADYLGENRLPSHRAISVERHFDPALIEAAFETPERAIDTGHLADALTVRILAEPRIAFHGDADVASVERIGERFTLACAGGERIAGFRQVVNASWDSRLAIDATIGLMPPRPWLHRYKLGLHIRQRAPTVAIPSVTLVLGSFGDIVDYGDGAYYFSWYPTGRTAISTALAPPPAAEVWLAQTGTTFIEPLRRIVPSVGWLDLAGATTRIVGGWIFAWGETDIDDRSSELHRRDEVGVHSVSGYHTINTGKLTLAPLHALTLAERIAPRT